MKQPFFSIIIPVYNRANSISEVIDSVLLQTYTDYEIIVVDDGSSDRVLLLSVLKKYPLVKVMLRDNGGGGAARNTGILAAKGKYIAFLDSDDFFLPEKLQTCYEYIESKNINDLFLFTSFYVDRGVGRTWIKPDRKFNGIERIDDYLTTGPGWTQTSAIIVDSQLAKKIKFDDNLPSSQDTDFTIRCFLDGASFRFLDKPLSIMNDIYDPQRVSKQKNVKPLIEWIDGLAEKGISKRSNLAYKGWQCARIISESNRVLALMLFFRAFLYGCYSIPTSIRIFCQIIFAESTYQRLMTFMVKILGRK